MTELGFKFSLPPESVITLYTDGAKKKYTHFKKQKNWIKPVIIYTNSKSLNTNHVYTFFWYPNGTPGIIKPFRPNNLGINPLDHAILNEAAS